jgi:hypothetical protein
VQTTPVLQRSVESIGTREEDEAKRVPQQLKQQRMSRNVEDPKQDGRRRSLRGDGDMHTKSHQRSNQNGSQINRGPDEAGAGGTTKNRGRG